MKKMFLDMSLKNLFGGKRWMRNMLKLRIAECLP